MMKWFRVWMTVLLLLPAAPAAWAAQDAASVQAAEAVVKQAASDALQALHSQSKSELAKPAVVHKLVSRYILPAVDIQASSRLVLGHYWRTATPAQRSAFVEQFQELLIRTYSKALSQYPDSSIQYLSNRDTSDGRFATVYSRVVPQGHEPVTVNYSLFKTNQGWKIYDLTISGLSLVQSYRSTYSEEIQQTGLDALIKRLTQQNQQAQSGTQSQAGS
ncbi:MAG: ABC transporter substrate-binding protein [Acidihalobacter sp.]|uniref:MlaC/ttg2D family ABC transporter substrate-binding protein n=1 Tax=Acidihalobacter sp. TaxID=1872108 RepID=UPI00307D5697